MGHSLRFVAVGAVLALSACNDVEQAGKPVSEVTVKPTVAAYAAEAESRLEAAALEGSKAAWVAQNFITEDTQYLTAKVNERNSLLSVELAQGAAEYDNLDLDPVVRRKLNLIKLGLTLPVPNNPQKAAELAKIGAELEAVYGSGQYTTRAGKTMQLQEMEAVLANSRDPAELLEMWTGWRTVSPPMKSKYTRQVHIANEGARNLGYQNVGAMWRSGYDMEPEAFAAQVDEVWRQVKPLYESLQCHVRAKLTEQYGADVVGESGKIPAHLLGNMWAQQWGNIYPLVAPEGADPGYDVTELLKTADLSETNMVKTGENFFVSLGFDPLPQTFWERSLITKPRDRDVVCHASAWDIDPTNNDLRIKMCTERTAEMFQTIHHELGHIFYFQAYREQPFLFRTGANDGFHEALGDTVALSLTPSYLKQIGLIKEEPAADKDMGLLMARALDKVAFLPFGLLVDKWRWQVFSGELSPEQYNSGWWALREAYQGIEAPVARSEANFDPGAKYHIPANVPYMRYFLAHIQQFQFHKALCDAAGYEGPLHRCTIYNNKDAGKLLIDMMKMGASHPWPDAMEAITGQRELDASALLNYFAPLKAWLDIQNQERSCGWQ